MIVNEANQLKPNQKVKIAIHHRVTFVRSTLIKTQPEKQNVQW